MNKYLESPSTDFQRVRDGRASMPFYVDVDLTAARSKSNASALILNIAANSLYIDADTANVGNAIIHFQDIALSNVAAPMFVSPGFIANVPFTQLLIENTAQPGKRLRIFYGVDIDFQAGVNASIAISGTVVIGSPVNVRPESASSNYAAASALAANTAVAAFLPAANTNGCLLLSASFLDGNATVYPSVSLIAKNSAPTSPTDGEVILASTAWYGSYYSAAELKQSVLIPAGIGLYFISHVATIGGFHRVARWRML